jgi:hypothetical protein
MGNDLPEETGGYSGGEYEEEMCRSQASFPDQVPIFRAEMFDCEIQTDDVLVTSHEDQSALLAEHESHIARME